MKLCTYPRFLQLSTGSNEIGFHGPATWGRSTSIERRTLSLKLESQGLDSQTTLTYSEDAPLAEVGLSGLCTKYLRQSISSSSSTCPDHGSTDPDGNSRAIIPWVFPQRHLSTSAPSAELLRVSMTPCLYGEHLEEKALPTAPS